MPLRLFLEHGAAITLDLKSEHLILMALFNWDGLNNLRFPWLSTDMHTQISNEKAARSG